MTKQASAQETTAKKPINLEYERSRDRELVKGIFKDYEVPGGRMGFNFHKYKNDPYERFDFVDGQVYTIPLGVAKHLNNDCWYPIHDYATDEHGKPLQKISQKVHRYGFQSLEFMEVDGLNSSHKGIVTVENI